MGGSRNANKGGRGESVARGYLEGLGFSILATQYRCPYGEIDIIAKDSGDVLVFIEVKYRKGLRAGLPIEAVTPAKCKAMTKTAMWYIGANDINDTDMRFDVIQVFGSEVLDVRHTKNAFFADS